MIARALLVAAVAATTGCEQLADGFDFDRQEVPVFQRSALVPADSTPGRLKVMAWNIKFGAARIDFWFDYWGDRVQLTPAEAERNMADLCALIREVDPDLLMTEEIEVNSRRSAYRDMVQDILEQTTLNYAAYYQSWNSRYILSGGLGRMDLGNAIFSKHPITFAERIRQVDRTDQSALTAKFYIHRMIGRALVAVDGREVAAYVVHTEAYDQDGTKGRQIAQIHDEVSAEKRPWVLGGDFNELPPTAVKLSDFPDEHPDAKGTEYEQPPYTPKLMQPFFDDFAPWITLEQYGTTEAEQRRWYTHSVLGPLSRDNNGEPGFWNRTLDYLFASEPGSWAAGASDVLQTAGRLGIRSEPLMLSDHAPVAGTWVLP
jgi:endonuclease/exonuclease/phosphatase family metal-dependent hydrolase